MIDKDGNIFDKATGKMLGKLSKKNLAKWLEWLKAIGKLSCIGDVLIFRDWINTTGHALMPENPFFDSPDPDPKDQYWL